MFRMLLISVAAMLLLLASAFQYNWVESALARESRATLDSQWAAMRGYLRLDFDTASQKIAGHWYYDSDDPDEDAIVTRIRAASLIADERGQVLSASPLAQDLGLISAPEISSRMQEARTGAAAVWYSRRNARGVPYLVRSGILYDEHRRSPYFVAIAASLAPGERRLPAFFAGVAAVIAAGCLLGWSLGRRSVPSAV